MAEKTDLNISPYYDDYNEDKNFHKVLFRASRPLQARELTQSQSILQNQVEKFGDHFFKEGAIVQGAQTDIDMEAYYVKVSAANPNSNGDANVETYRTATHEQYLQGKTSGVIAKCVYSAAETEDESLTLFVKYISQGTNDTHSFAFLANEELQVVTLDGDGNASEVGSNNNDFTVLSADKLPIGRGSLAKITEGIVYVRGFFVKVPAQTLILEKFSGRPSYRIGLSIVESLISSAEDSSLLDNSSGTTNENAAGADRLKISLTLSKFAIDTTDDINFVELARVSQGLIESLVNTTRYGDGITSTLARRTFDANGDFVLRQFTHSLREHLDDTTNRGFYPKRYGGVEDKFVLQISPGKAYVRGYEIDKIGTTNLPFSKARSTKSIQDANTPIRLGNHLRVYNAHSLPEFGNETGSDSIDPFNTCKLWPSVVSSAGTENSEDPIGFARVRDITLREGTDSSNVYTDASVWELSMFDIKMFTKISGTQTNTFTAGDRVVGSSSGASGIVAYTSSGQLYVHDVVGTFTTSDSISSQGSNTGSISTVTAVRNYNIDRVRSITQVPENTSREVFTADVQLDADKTLTGTVIFASGSPTVTGFGTKYVSELKEGDLVYNPSASELLVVSSVTNDTSFTATTNAGGSYQGNATRRRAQLHNQDQTVNIFSWPRNWIASHTPESVTIKKQEVVTISSGSFTVDTDSNGTFLQRNTDNFSIAVVEESSGSPTINNGDILNIEDYTLSVTTSGSGQQLTVSGFDSADNGARLKVTFSASYVNPVNRDKTLRQARCLKVGSARSAGGFYGTAYDDKDISLGVTDAFKIRGIYEGVDGTPLPPNAAFSISSGTPVAYEKIVGQTSDAHAVIITYNGSGATSYFYYTNNNRFQDGETVIGQTSNAIFTVGSISAGSPNITKRYFFDDGQRDGFYDLSKLTRKAGEPAPNNAILVVFDYFTSSGGGDFYDVNSYSSIDYKDIPVYSPSRVDLGGLEPDGTYELSDSVDFRPSVGQVLGSSTFATANADPTSPVDLSNSSTGAVYAPMSYDTGRSYKSSRTGITSSNASVVDTPVNETSVVGDLSFYVGRIDKVFLHRSGEFRLSQGIPALSPTKPKSLDESIEMFELTIPPYTLNLSEIKVRSFEHRRYTMSDIGKINNRVTNLERITSLSLLEKDTQTKQILDSDGFDRFKSGFLVDNFRGHRVGDTQHPDYSISIDNKLGAMRPKNFTQFFDIELNTGASGSYQKTGDLITLPYTEQTYINNTKASRQINVNPYNVFAFIGNIKLTPATDIWQDTEQLPEVRVNREGNFDALSGINGIGTVWNNWQTTWVGEPRTVSSQVTATSNGQWSGDPAQGGEWQAGFQLTREITETPETQTRTGVTTSVVEDFVETRNDRIVSVSVVPFIRARTIEIDATNLKPNTNHFIFFDGIRVDQYVRPFSGSFSQDGGTGASSGVKTNGNGRLRAYFDIPSNSAQRFPTGQRDLRITSSFYNLTNPASSGNTQYQAQGLLQSSQTEIVSTRNGRIVTETTSENRDFSSRGEILNSTAIDTSATPYPSPPEIPPAAQIPVDNTSVPEPVSEPTLPTPEPAPQWSPIAAPVPEPSPPIPTVTEPVVEDLWVEPWFERRDLARLPIWRREFQEDQDPLAQSFLVDASGGMFLTSVGIYFATKDESIPVRVEIRNMVNGYPGQVILPFSDVTKNPSEVTTSVDGSVATTFTFDSPVYLEQGKEYCFVVLSNSDKYEAFISRMGEPDLITGQTIAEQPATGSLFMSQNASTWTAEQTDDLKFHLKHAKFDTTKYADLRFDNAALPVANLQDNPIESFSGQNYVKVYSYTHGMYTTSSNVTVSGVTGNMTGCVVNIGGASLVTGSLPADGTYTGIATTTDVGSSGQNCTVDIVVSSGAITSTKISNPGLSYTTDNTLTVTNFGGVSETNSVTIAIDTVAETLGGIPVDAINQTFTSISNIGIDSFCVIPDVSSYDFVSGYTAVESTLSGGADAKSTRNYYFDAIHTMIPNTMLESTLISVAVNTTAMDSPEGYSGGGTAYQMRAAGDMITLNDNVFFSSPSIVASPINETNEMSSQKSFYCRVQMKTQNSNVSPVLDVATIGCLGIANRINEINSSNDVPLGTTYIASTEPDGDNNKMVYVTKKVNLKTPATALRVTADIFNPPTTNVKFMYKVLRNDEATPFDDTGWEYFNSNGSPDSSLVSDARNFKEYEFTVENLPEFGAFAIKVIGQGSNTSVVPLVSALRCIALAT